jgi:signal transduction histidine kinase
VQDESKATSETSILEPESSVSLKEENRRLRFEVKELRLSQRVSDEYLSVVTHELSTPLTAIKAYIEALVSNYGQPEFTQGPEFLRVLERETSRLIRLVDRTQQISRLTNGNQVVRSSQVFLQDIVEEVTDALRPLFEERSVEFLSDLPVEMQTVAADRDLLKQLLINLVHNAVKFSQPEGKVFLRADVTKTHVEISVEDEGCGVALEDRERIFEPFYRCSHATAIVERGSGLGLAIAKTIVEQHGGLITMESEVDKGTVFRFTLPMP